MIELPPTLITQCLKDIEARDHNGGFWVGGRIPESILEVIQTAHFQTSTYRVQLAVDLVTDFGKRWVQNDLLA